MILAGSPLKGKELNNLKDFLARMELQYDEGIEYSICLLNDAYQIIGTGSVEQNVLKCIAIDPDYQGQGLSATLISGLVQYEFEHGRTHLFLYTKPKNQSMFEDLSFYTIQETENVLFMENRKMGFTSFLDKLKKETPEEAFAEGKKIGAIVANCNPFTKGHEYLMELAAAECDFVHVFILSDNRSRFPAKDRYQLVKEGTSHLKNIILHETMDYMISAATFPTYFLKETVTPEAASGALDVEVFGSRIAPELRIRTRYVGTEPNCRVTNQYNETLRNRLPAYGIEVKEIERLSKFHTYVSASTVRKCLEKKDFETIKHMVPDVTYQYLMKCEDREKP